MPNTTSKIYFKYKKHPGDFFRDESIQLLPNPKDDEESFWIWFHPNYQSSEDIALLNNLFLLFEKEPQNREIINNIEKLKIKITLDSFENFYNQVLLGEIIIIKK